MRAELVIAHVIITFKSAPVGGHYWLFGRPAITVGCPGRDLHLGVIGAERLALASTPCSLLGRFFRSDASENESASVRTVSTPSSASAWLTVRAGRLRPETGEFAVRRSLAASAGSLPMAQQEDRANA